MALGPYHGMPPGGYGHMRTSTADRERAIDVLKAGFAEGRLTQEEYTERVGRVYHSRTYAELAALTADLPAGPLGALTPSSPPPPPAYHVAPDQRPLNGLAVASLVCALIPGIPWLAVLLGIAARGQIRERGERGAALANAGLAIGGFFTLVLILYVLGNR